MNEVLLHTTSCLEADLFLQTHSTNPLLRSESIRAAIDAFSRTLGEYDSMFSVTRRQTRLWDGLTRPINHNPAFLLRTQDLPPVFEENSCMYLFPGELLRDLRNRIGIRPLMWEVAAEEAVDIDEEIDFRVAEVLMKARLGVIA